MAAGVLPLWAVPGVQHVHGVLVVHVVDCATMYRRMQSCTMVTVGTQQSTQCMCASTCHCNISVYEDDWRHVVTSGRLPTCLTVGTAIRLH
jgi:hypothetical protein